MNSANPPGPVTPRARRSRQSSGLPRAQNSQRPQPELPLTATVPPTSSPSTPSPSASTSPNGSCPGVSGNEAKKVPSWMWRSVPQIPVAAMATRTSPGPGSGVGTVVTEKRRGAS